MKKNESESIRKSKATGFHVLLASFILLLASCGVDSVPKRGKIGTEAEPIVLKEAPKESPNEESENGSEKATTPIDEIEMDPNAPTPELPAGSFTWIATCTGWPLANKDKENTDANNSLAELYLNSEQPLVLIQTELTQTYAVLKIANASVTSPDDDETEKDETGRGATERLLTIEREGDFSFVLPSGKDALTSLYRGEEKLADLKCTTAE